MAATKKQKKLNKKPKVHNLGEAMEKKAWKRVKIKGNVISDDGAGFEGLIGLEVLENYDSGMVKAKAPKQHLDERKEKKSRKRKLNDDDSNCEDDDSDDDAGVATGKPKSKKDRVADRKAKVLERRKERREKRKAKKKEEKSAKAATKKGKGETDRSSDRFALLRPPPEESDNDQEVVKDDDNEEDVPQLVPIKEQSVDSPDLDDLGAWNGLGTPQTILRALAEKGFKSPTEIQAMTLPAAIMGKKDILGAAETGSGKTLAFGIPLLAGIMELKSRNIRSGVRRAPKSNTNENEANEEVNEDSDERADNDGEHELTPPPEEIDNFPEMPTEDEASSGDSSDESDDDDEDDEKIKKKKKGHSPLYAIVLTPTRELAVQVRDHLVAAAKYTGIKIVAIFGGLSMDKQERLLRQRPEIVVATPGRLWELYQQDNPHLRKIEDISFLVIDETDRMVEKGHFEELRSLLKVLNADEQKKRSRQNFVFSATLTLVHDLPDHMQKKNLGKRSKFFKQTPGMKIQGLIEELGISQPKVVDITRSQQTAQTLTECRLICPLEEKDFYLYYFVERHPGRTIVFCNSIECVKRLATLFGLLDCHPLPLHANMVQKQRLKNLERFRDNPRGLLIATDVAARGLDIPNVEHVIHYQVPRTSENYVHRSGRTARANKDGITVMFMEPGEVKSYVKLYKTLDRKEDLPLFPISERYLAAVKERVNLARDVDKQELKLRRSQSDIGWMKKHAEEMDMIIDGFNDEPASDDDEDPFIIERRRNRIQLEQARAELKNLLGKEIFPRGFSFKYPTSTGQLQMPGMSAIDEANRRGGEATGDDDGVNSAVKAVKDSIEELKMAKKMRNKKKKS